MRVIVIPGGRGIQWKLIKRLEDIDFVVDLCQDGCADPDIQSVCRKRGNAA